MSTIFICVLRYQAYTQPGNSRPRMDRNGSRSGRSRSSGRYQVRARL